MALNSSDKCRSVSVISFGFSFIVIKASCLSDAESLKLKELALIERIAEAVGHKHNGWTVGTFTKSRSVLNWRSLQAMQAYLEHNLVTAKILTFFNSFVEGRTV